MRPTFKDLRLALRLLVRPDLLTDSAVNISRFSALAAGAAAGALLITLLLLGPVVGGGEPYRDFADYARDALHIGSLLFLVMGALYGGALICIALALRCLTWYPDRVRIRIGLIFHAAMLAPISLIPVAIAWFVFAALRYAQHTNFQFYGIAKPAWIHSPTITTLGSPWWILAILLAWLAMSAMSGVRIWRMSLPDAHQHCSSCGYPLKGLPEPGCPECGAGRDDPA